MPFPCRNLTASIGLVGATLSLTALKTPQAQAQEVDPVLISGLSYRWIGPGGTR